MFFCKFANERNFCSVLQSSPQFRVLSFSCPRNIMNVSFFLYDIIRHYFCVFYEVIFHFVVSLIVFFFICRRGYSDHLLHHSVSFCTPTLWHSSRWVLLRTNCVGMATMYEHTRTIQCISLEPTRVSSSFAVLHVQVLKEDKKKRVDVPWGNIVVHNW